MSYIMYVSCSAKRENNFTVQNFCNKMMFNPSKVQKRVKMLILPHFW